MFFFNFLFKFHDEKSYLELCQKVVCRTNCKVLILWMMNLFPTVNVCHPDSIRALMKISSNKPVGFTGPYRMLKPWLGK